MGNRIQSYLAGGGNINYRSAPTNCEIDIGGGKIYKITGTNYIRINRSYDYGKTWLFPYLEAGLNTGSYSPTVWYDGWSGLVTGLIHVVYVDDVNDDVRYFNIDTLNNDTVSAEVVVQIGGSAAADGTLSITRTRGGNLICGGCIDAGTEIFFKKSTDTGATWNNIGSAYEATTDQLILCPGFAADNQDAICIYWDASADEISRKLYDDSANSWVETLISGSMVDLLASTAYPNFSAAVDLTNSQIILVAWENTDTAGADLKCWTITEGAITAKTDVVTASGDDQGLCVIGLDINTGYWYCFYCGKSDGSETWGTSVNIYFKCSQDSGSTWGSENSVFSINTNITYISTPMRHYGNIIVSGNCIGTTTKATLPNFYWGFPLMLQPKSTYQLGL